MAKSIERELAEVDVPETPEYRAQNEAYKESESLKMGKGVVCQ